jgi:hypothetical protein
LGDYLLWAVFLNYVRTLLKLLAYFLHTKCYVLFLTNIALGYILGDFPQTNLVTLVEVAAARVTR